MGKAAIRSFSKILKKCPRCGDQAPKELMEKGRGFVAYCAACGHSFRTERGCLSILLWMIGGFVGISIISTLMKERDPADRTPEGARLAKDRKALTHIDEMPAVPGPEPAAVTQQAVKASATPTPPATPYPLAEAAASQKLALQRYPQLGVAGSDFNRRFVAAVEAARRSEPEVVSRADWPMVIAERVAK